MATEHSALLSCSSLLLSGLHISTQLLPHCCGADSHTSSVPSPLHPKSQNILVLESDKKKCKKPCEFVILYPQSNHWPGLRLKTGNGPSRPAMRQGWWESRGILYCCLWRGRTSGPLPSPSGPVPHRQAHPAPPDCPCWSPGCWGVGCGRAERWWKRATEGVHRGFLLGCRGRVVPLHRQRSRCSARRCWSRRRHSRKAHWCAQDLTGPGHLWGRYQHLAQKV